MEHMASLGRYQEAGNDFTTSAVLRGRTGDCLLPLMRLFILQRPLNKDAIYKVRSSMIPLSPVLDPLLTLPLPLIIVAS